MERIVTGIEGLDEKMEGGLVAGSINLVAGKTGTGKTQFSSSFIYAGALNKEPGVYITTEEREQDIKNDIYSMFGWDLQKLEDARLLKFASIKPIFPDKPIADEINRVTRAYITNVSSTVSNTIRTIKAKRLVIDSISILEMFIQDPYLARVALMGLTEHLRALGVTTILPGEVSETSEGLSGSGIIEYLVDTVIRLDFVPVSEEFKRTVTIRKMRRTNHSTLIHPFEITKKGIRIVQL